MDLSQVLWKKLSPSGVCGIIFGLIILLSACTTLPTERLPTTQQVLAVETKPDKTEAALKTVPLTAELTYLILTAEVASQRGDLISAAELYKRAAGLVESPKLASRSTQMANFGDSTSPAARLYNSAALIRSPRWLAISAVKIR